MAEFHGTVELIAGITPKNGGDFALVGAHDVQVDDQGNRLDTEFSNLKSALNYSQIRTEEDLKPEMFLKFIVTNVGIGNIVDVNTLAGTSSYHRVVKCFKGDVFYCKGYGTNSDARFWAFVDNDYKLLSISGTTAIDEEVTAPSDGYAIFNISSNSYSSNSVLCIKRLLQYENKDQIKRFSTLKSIDVTSKFISNKYIKTSWSKGTVIDVNSPTSSNNRNYFISDVCKGEKITITGTGGVDPRLWAFLDCDYRLARNSGSNAIADSLELDVLQDGYFIVNVDKSADYEVIMHRYALLHGNSSTSNGVINPLDYGVVGDGITDCTDEINEALADAEGKEIYFPSGTYLFSKTLHIPSNTHVRGDGYNTVFQLADTFTLDSIVHRESEGWYKLPMIMVDENSSSCKLERFKLSGQVSSFKDEAEVGLLVMGNDHIVDSVFVENINFFPDDFAGRTTNGPAWGFMIFKANRVRVSNCRAENCGYESIGTEQSQNVLVDKFFSGFCNQTCLQIHRNSYNVTFFDCTVDYELTEGRTVRPAFTMHGATEDHDLNNIKIDRCNFLGGITFIGGYENGVLITNNVATGGITMNAAINRQNIVIHGNRLGGGISGRYANAIITDNMATNNTGGRFITVNGDNIVCAHNIPLGTGRYVAINDVTVEQWGTNPSLN